MRACSAPSACGAWLLPRRLPQRLPLLTLNWSCSGRVVTVSDYRTDGRDFTDGYDRDPGTDWGTDPTDFGFLVSDVLPVGTVLYSLALIGLINERAVRRARVVVGDRNPRDVIGVRHRRNALRDRLRSGGDRPPVGRPGPGAPAPGGDPDVAASASVRAE